MQFSCHTWAFSDLSLTEALGTIARMGFRYVDLGSGAHLHTAEAIQHPRQTVAAIRTDLKLFNLEVADLYLMLPRISLLDETLRRRDIEAFKALLPFAQALGTPGITVSPGLVHPPEDTSAVQRSCEALREMVAESEKYGLRVSMEPHMDSMVQSAPLARDFVREVKGLQLTVDWAQLVCADVFHDDIAALLPHARHIHLRQAARAQMQTPFNRGRIEVPRVVAALREAHYDGKICVELMKGPGPHGMLEVDAVRECLLMRDALRAARDAAA